MIGGFAMGGFGPMMAATALLRAGDEQQHTEQVLIGPVTTALKKQEYDKILADKELFWALFCKVVTENGSKVTPQNSIGFTRSETSVLFAAMKYPFHEIKNAVESIRQLFEKNATEKRNFTILAIKRGGITLKEPSTSAIKADGHGSIIKERYVAYIQPTMALLAKAFGASCEKIKVTQEIISIISTKKKEVEGWSIKWNSEERYVYPIDPCQTYKSPDMRKALYDMYKDKAQPMCDYSLVAHDGTALKVHSLVLAIYGGDALKLAMNQMKEAANKAITIPDASSQTIAHLAEYLYRGPAALEPESLRGQEIDIISLFAIGHRYQIPGLVDSCTNVILATSSVKDIESVMDIAATYKNAKLAELGLHLIKQDNAPPKPQEVQIQSLPHDHEDLYGVD